MNTLDLVLLILLTIAALWTVIRGSLLRAAIALAVTSVILTVLMFRFASPLAAVFELSVCAGLITVIFMSTISLTKPLAPGEAAAQAKKRYRRFLFLPLLVLLAGTGLALINIPFDIVLPQSPADGADVRTVLWTMRQLDVLGQVIIILAGVFGVVVLFKDKFKGNSEI